MVTPITSKFGHEVFCASCINFWVEIEGVHPVVSMMNVLNKCIILSNDRLCGLVVRVSGYRYRDLGFDSRRYQIFLSSLGLERGPLSLVRSTEELL